MKAVEIDRFGGPEELKLVEVDRPTPGPEQILICTEYASVNPADWKGRAGLLPHLSYFPFPMIIGLDCAGVVEEVGPGVTEFKVGDRVISLSGMGLGLSGTYAEYCCVPVQRTALLPEHLDFAQGATIPIASASAASSILDVAKINEGDIVLVNGGSGSVGTFAIQFLKFLGARVAATCSTRNVDYVRGLGADLVIDYTCEDIVECLRDWASGGLDSVIDTVGQHSLPSNMPALIRSGGTLVCITNLITGVEAFDLELAESRGVNVVDNVQAAMTSNPLFFQVSAFHKILDAIKDRRIKTPPYEVMSLSRVAEAHRIVEDGHVRGKILLSVRE